MFAPNQGHQQLRYKLQLPIAVSQVHKAVIRVDGKATTVAVKVRHPGVERRIIQDFQLLIPLARATSKFKALKVSINPHACPTCGRTPRRRCYIDKPA
jgi:ABC1 atypical kinase-like domain